MTNTNGPSETFVAAVRLRDSVRASLCRSALQNAGVETWLSPENLAAIAPHLGIAIGIEILVRESDLAVAREVIEQLERGALALPEEPDPCPKCGATGAVHAARPDRAGALLGQLLAGVPRPDVVWTWRCVACDHCWQ
jgi:hypothetical protein